MEKTEHHAIELPSIICKVIVLEKSSEEKVKQKGKFTQENERMMDVEFDTGQLNIKRETYFTLNIQKVNAATGDWTKIEVALTEEEFFHFREFLGRTVSPFTQFNSPNFGG